MTFRPQCRIERIILCVISCTGFKRSTGVQYWILVLGVLLYSSTIVLGRVGFSHLIVSVSALWYSTTYQVSNQKITITAPIQFKNPKHCSTGYQARSGINTKCTNSQHVQSVLGLS